MVLLDTNAIIYYLQNERQAVACIDALHKKNESFVLSTITEVEVFSHPELQAETILNISQWMRDFIVVPVDSIIAREAARFRREFRLKTPDAIIVATAFSFGIPCVTRDAQLKKIKAITTIAC
ncbi:MAG: type II toxin-antitoxin system VapC family toxin [Candidatus Magasanikbacteria bacterium]|nr:type II toxin-antitoxin system VapC family toxin [Candidatus Magasanikbacteria bacterium]